MTTDEAIQGILGVTIGGTVVLSFWGSLFLLLLWAVFGIVLIPVAVLFQIFAVITTLILILMAVCNVNL
jgi:hypothetical protein